MTEYPVVSGERTLPASSVTQARTLQQQGNITGAWSVLGAAGDEYAAKAAQITDASTPSFFRSIVQTLWMLNGGDSALLYWDSVANQHL